MDTNEFDDADLYGDLPEFAGPQSDARVQQLEQHIEQLRSQVGSLCEERDRVTEQNKVLIRNISILYKTAVAELDRKNTTIKDLHTKLAAAGPIPRASTQRPQRENRPPAEVPAPSNTHTHKEHGERKRRRSSSRERVGVSKKQHYREHAGCTHRVQRHDGGYNDRPRR